MRFGMGLLNIQGQVQGVVIGLLLILSILLPSVAQQLASVKNLPINRQSILVVLGTIALFIAFFLFFFWSRTLVLSGS
jgi:rhamnose transport system permease protein